MALAIPTSLTTISSAATVGSLTTASVSPAARCLLVVGCFVASVATNPGLTISDTFTGTGTWTQIVTSVAAKGVCAIFYAVAGGSPGSGTITVTDNTGTANHWGIIVAQVTGADVTNPVAQSQFAGPVTTTTLALTLGATPRASSMTIGVLGSLTTGFTVGTNFTNLTSVTATSTLCEMEYDLTSATTTVDWSGLGTSHNDGVAIEVNAEAQVFLPIFPPGIEQLSHYRR